LVSSGKNYNLYVTINSQISDVFDDFSFISMHVASTITSKRELNINAETLATSWCIELEAAKKTLQVTMQKGI
jgi:hypothetical protein